MKTQIFRLDQYDDILSAQDQIGWSRTARICIVLPPKKHLHFSMVDFVLLAREANRIGVQAAFIVPDAGLRRGMQELGLLCFSTIRQANRSNWRTSQRTKIPDADTLRPDHHAPDWPVKPYPRSTGTVISRKIQIGFFSVALLALLMLGALFIPQSRVSIDRTPVEQTYRFTLQGDAMHATAPLSGVIHADRLVFSFNNEITVQASGEGSFGAEYATGEVLITNLTGQELTLPQGLTLQTEADEPVQFQTVEAVTLPAQPSEPQSVSVQAVLPGTAGNVPANSIRVVSGEIGLSLRVENPLPTGGGTDTRVSTLSARDVEQAREVLLEEMGGLAIEQAGTETRNGQLVIARSIQRDEILSEELSTQIDMPCQQALLTLGVSYTAWTVLEEDLLQISTRMLDTLLPENTLADEQTLQFQFDDPYIQQPNGFSQPVEISRQLLRSFASDDILDALAGQRTEQISGILEQHLEQYSEGEPLIHVSITPAWWPVMPFFRFQYKMIQP